MTERKDEMPDEQGFYWAKWRIKDAGTEEENEPCPDAWEVVNVFENCNDKNDAEYLRVFVGGVGRSQSLENFYWGEKVSRKDLSPPVPDDVAALNALCRLNDLALKCCAQNQEPDRPDLSQESRRQDFKIVEQAIRAASTPSSCRGCAAGCVQCCPRTPSAEVRALRDCLKLLRNHTSVNSHQIEIIDEALNQTHTGGK